MYLQVINVRHICTTTAILGNTKFPFNSPVRLASLANNNVYGNNGCVYKDTVKVSFLFFNIYIYIYEFVRYLGVHVLLDIIRRPYILMTRVYKHLGRETWDAIIEDKLRVVLVGKGQFCPTIKSGIVEGLNISSRRCRRMGGEGARGQLVAWVAYGMDSKLSTLANLNLILDFLTSSCSNLQDWPLPQCMACGLMCCPVWHG